MSLLYAQMFILLQHLKRMGRLSLGVIMVKEDITLDLTQEV